MKSWAAILLPLVLGGCSAFSVPEAKIWNLAPSSGQAKPMPIDRDLVIETPAALQSLDTSRIAFVGREGQQTYFNGVTWPDRAPVVVGENLVRSFRSASAFRTVVTSGAGIRGDLVLQSNLSDFEAIGNQDGTTTQVKIGMSFVLIDASNRKPVASTRFETTVPVEDTSFASVIAGFDHAAGDIAQEAIDWSRAASEKRS